MRTVNRGSIIVVPKQPFYDWANSLDPEHKMSPDDNAENCCYLIRDDHESDDIEKVVRKYYKEIFENELFGMWTDESAWPQNRTFKLFKEWFSFYSGSLTFDLLDKPILHDK
jgi:hypothetical protein